MRKYLVFKDGADAFIRGDNLSMTPYPTDKFSRWDPYSSWKSTWWSKGYWWATKNRKVVGHTKKW